MYILSKFITNMGNVKMADGHVGAAKKTDVNRKLTNCK